MTTPLTFQPGKFYETQDGRKRRVIMDDYAGAQPILTVDEASKMNVAYHFPDGRLNPPGEPDTTFDLIAEWKDAPSVDWSKMPAWAVAVAQDENKAWYWFDYAPVIEGSTYWHLPKDAPLPRASDEIPPAYCPKWSGDWRESLVTRPTEATK